jgi:hypothetical protein
MLLAAMQLAAENAHRVTASRVKRVEDLHLKSQTPGIMALARQALKVLPGASLIIGVLPA